MFFDTDSILTPMANNIKRNKHILTVSNFIECEINSQR